VVEMPAAGMTAWRVARRLNGSSQIRWGVRRAGEVGCVVL
jgi:hypothetical protein